MMAVTTTQNSVRVHEGVCAEVHVHSGHAGEQRAGEQQDRRQREHLHDLVRAVFGSDDQDVERACDPVPGVACGGERGVDSRGECDEPLGRFLRGERVELGVAQRREHLSVGRERPPQAADSTASVAEHPDLLLRVVARLRERLHVELVERLFDLVEGAEIAGYDPLQERREKRGRIEQADLAFSFGDSLESRRARRCRRCGRSAPSWNRGNSRRRSARDPGRAPRRRRQRPSPADGPRAARPPVSSPDRRASTRRHRPGRAHRAPRPPAPGTHPADRARAPDPCPDAEETRPSHRRSRPAAGRRGRPSPRDGHPHTARAAGDRCTFSSGVAVHHDAGARVSYAPGGTRPAVVQNVIG